MKLWTAHLEALQGYYASDVYVVAETQEEAIQKAAAGLEEYFDDQVREFGISFLIYDDNMPDDPEFAQNRADWLEAAKTELTQKLESTTDVLIDVRV